MKDLIFSCVLTLLMFAYFHIIYLPQNTKKNDNKRNSNS